MTSIPQRLLGEALLISTKNTPSKIALIVKSKEYTYAELKESAEKLAEYLVRSGIKKGDRIAISMENSWQTVVSVYGATLSGAVFLVINPQTKSDKLQYILNDSGAKALISNSILKHELSSALKATNTVREVIITGDEKQISVEGLKIRLSNFESIMQN